MPRTPYRLTAVGMTLVVIAAQLACVCPVAGAPAPAPKAPAESQQPTATHRCCDQRNVLPHTGSTPAEHPHHREGCRHCDGGAAVTTPPDTARSSDGVPPVLNPFAPGVDVAALATSPVDLSTCPARCIPPPALSPPTLLGLCCALNL